MSFVSVEQLVARARARDRRDTHVCVLRVCYYYTAITTTITAGNSNTVTITRQCTITLVHCRGILLIYVEQYRRKLKHLSVFRITSITVSRDSCHFDLTRCDIPITISRARNTIFHIEGFFLLTHCSVVARTIFSINLKNTTK